MICFSVSSDSTLKIWDVSTGKCVKTLGDANAHNRKVSSFHKDSIITMDICADAETIFTGGRDGSIYCTNLNDQSYYKLFQGDLK
jgi:WD40 repeat protein